MGMQTIESSAFYNMIMGRNCFCSLCFKTVADSVVHMDDNIFIAIQDNQMEVEVSEIITEVLGVELYNELSSFDPICTACIKAAISCFKFIRKCKNNITDLCKVVDTFTTGIKDASNSLPKGMKSAFVSIDTRRCKWNKYFSKLVSSTRPRAYSSFTKLKDEKNYFEKQKKAQVQKKLLKIDLTRIEDVLGKTWYDAETNKDEDSCTINNKIKTKRKKLCSIPRKRGKQMVSDITNADNTIIIEIKSEPKEVSDVKSVQFNGCSESFEQSSELEPKWYEITLNPIKCKHCCVTCKNSVEFSNHLKTHEQLVLAPRKPPNILKRNHNTVKYAVNNINKQ